MHLWRLIKEYLRRQKQGYILCKILWPGGGGNGAGEKNEKWGSGEKNEKEGKRGKEKEEKEKGERDFLLILCTLLLIIVY